MERTGEGGRGRGGGRGKGGYCFVRCGGFFGLERVGSGASGWERCWRGVRGFVRDFEEGFCSLLWGKEILALE